MTQLMTRHDMTTLVMTEVMTIAEIDCKKLMFLASHLSCWDLQEPWFFGDSTESYVDDLQDIWYFPGSSSAARQATCKSFAYFGGKISAKWQLLKFWWLAWLKLKTFLWLGQQKWQIMTQVKTHESSKCRQWRPSDDPLSRKWRPGDDPLVVSENPVTTHVVISYDPMMTHLSLVKPGDDTPSCK